MKQYVTNTTNTKTLFVEIHDGTNPNYFQMAPILQELRATAKSNGIPFFVFTTIREPLSYAISFYNFQHLSKSGRGGRYQVGNATESDFMRLSLPDPQCLFFARGEMSTRKKFEHLRANFYPAECRTLYHNQILDTVDWVGTTENMSNETLPILSYMLTGINKKQKKGQEVIDMKVNSIKQTNHAEADYIHVDRLSNEAIQYIRNITMGDMEWYKKIQHDYNYDNVVYI